jgi:PAS domain S-box-containing protein
VDTSLGILGTGLYELSWRHSLYGKVILEIPSGTVVACNPAAETQFCLSRDQLIGAHLLDLVPESERARVRLELETLTALPSQYNEFHALRGDGISSPVIIWNSGLINVEGGKSALICEFQDISELEQQEHRLATKRWALSAYAAAARALSQRHSRDSLLAAICEGITGESAYVYAWVALADDAPEKLLRVAAEAGRGIGILDGLRLSWSENDPAGQGPTPISIRSGQIQVLDDTERMPAPSPWTERFGDFGIRSSVSIPFAADGLVRGALVVCSATPKAFEPVAIEVFTHLTEQIAHGIHAIAQDELLFAERENLVNTERRLAVALAGMIAPIVLAMEMRDPYTAGHQARVAEIAVAIGEEMGWSRDRLEGLSIAAQVHDIGKISVPAEILTKPGRLSDVERALINLHPETGYAILKDTPFPWKVAEIVRQHHEKLDGSGYPRGLRSDEILPEAKVLAVADMLEAMVTHRPYRPGIQLDAVLAYLESEADVHLDPEAVRVCARLFREGRLVVSPPPSLPI